MSDTRQLELIDPDVIGGTEDEPRLIGSECERCGTVTFPRQRSCPRCTSEDVHPRELATRGALWTWTIQCFAPKAPPYLPEGVEEFEPYGVGYIELPGEVRVEARLTESEPERLRSLTTPVGCAATWWRARPCWPSLVSNDGDPPPAADRS